MTEPCELTDEDVFILKPWRGHGEHRSAAINQDGTISYTLGNFESETEPMPRHAMRGWLEQVLGSSILSALTEIQYVECGGAHPATIMLKWARVSGFDFEYPHDSAEAVDSFLSDAKELLGRDPFLGDIGLVDSMLIARRLAEDPPEWNITKAELTRFDIACAIAQPELTKFRRPRAAEGWELP